MANVIKTFDNIRIGDEDVDKYAAFTYEATSDDVITGAFIGINGVQTSSSVFVCTDYIDVFGCGGSTVTMHAMLYANAGIAWYDEAKQCIGYVNENNKADYGITYPTATGFVDISIKMPTKTKYVRLSAHAPRYSSPSDFYVRRGYFNDADFALKLYEIDGIDDKVDELQSVVGDIDYYNLVDYDSLVPGTYIVTANGNEATTTNLQLAATKYLWLKPNTTYNADGVTLTGNYAFYDENKTFTSNPSATIETENAYKGKIITGSSGYYFRTTVFLSRDYPFQFISSYLDVYHDYGIVTIDDKIEASSSGKSIRTKVLVIGDSISTDYYGNYPKWVTVLKNEKFLPTDTTNDSMHATGFVARYNNEANDFITRIEAITDKSSYDMVVVFGGINDYIQSVPLGGGAGETDKATYFKPAVDYFFDYVIQNFTQARICVLLPLRTSATWANSAGEYQQAYSQYIHDVAKSYCLPVLNLTEESGFCPFIASFRDMWTLLPSGFETHDGVHPNEEYEHDFLAPMIKDFLRGM